MAMIGKVRRMHHRQKKSVREIDTLISDDPTVSPLKVLDTCRLRRGRVGHGSRP